MQGRKRGSRMRVFRHAPGRKRGSRMRVFRHAMKEARE